MGQGIAHDSVVRFGDNPRFIHRAELVLVKDTPKES